MRVPAGHERRGSGGRATTPVTRHPRRAGNLRLLYPGAFIVYGDRFAIPPVLLAISRDFNEPLGAVATIATAYFLLYGLMQVPYGILSDRVGRVRVMRWALYGTGLGNLLAAIAPSLPVLVGAKAATAGLAAAVLPASLVYVGDTVPFVHRQGIIANVLAAGAAGTVLATVGAGFLAGLDAWRVAFAVPAVFALGLGVRLGRLPESLPAAERGAGPLGQVRRVVTQPWAVFVILMAVAEGAVMVGLLTFLAPALEAHGQSAAVAGLVVATYGVAVFGGMQLVRGALRRRGTSQTGLIAAGGSLLAAAYLAAAIDQGVVNILGASVLIGLGYCCMHSTLQTWATEVVPAARGTVIALFVTGVFAGAALGTAAVSRLASANRYGTMFLVAAAAALPLTAIVAWGRSRYPSPAPAPAGQVCR